MIENPTYALRYIQKLFKIDEKVKSRQTIFNAEERGEIPKAVRHPRGSTGNVRRWTVEQLPYIGRKFGFLKHPEHQHILSFYTQKGGCLKSTLSYSIARLLALNGIRTLIVGLDIQGSVTNISVPKPVVDTIEELKEIKRSWGGLYHLLYQDFELADVLKNTDLPTLDVIPETSELMMLEKTIRNEVAREHQFKEKLLPMLSDYQVVIFDNSPNWNSLVENSLSAATSVISPVGCDVGTFDVLDTNMDTIRDFQKKAKLHWDNFLLVPTLLEKTKLSQQIYMAYCAAHSAYLIPYAIRRAVIGQEAAYVRRSVIEQDPTSQLAGDYYDLIIELWKRIEG
jgi:chromosome partitioning protein